jgi:hypothetical protein
MLSKENNSEKINLSIKSTKDLNVTNNNNKSQNKSHNNSYINNLNNLSFEEKIKKYNAVCFIDMDKTNSEIMDLVEYKKKKNIKVPLFPFDQLSRKYQTNSDYKVLIYDKQSELVIRNKILECCLKVFNQKFNIDVDSKNVFKVFNNEYDEIVDNTKLFSLIHNFYFKVDSKFDDNN